jgi:photosystem II stability/assembly factor-like uncharacterized protein
VVEPGSPATLLAATAAGVYRSADGGRTWAFSGTGLPSRAEVREIVAAPSDPSTVFLNASGSLFRSADGGRTWELAYAPTFSVDSLAINPRDAAIIYFADGPNLLRSRDGGETWTRIFSRTVAEVLVLDPTDPDTLYAASLDTVFKSTDGGATWTASNTLSNGGTLRGRFFALAVAPGDPGRVYLSGESGFYRSDDAGATWTHVSTTIGLTFLFVDPRQTSTLYGASREGVTLVVSRDGGETWHDAGNRPPAVSIRGLAFDPVTRLLYAGTADQGVLKIVRGGRQWRVDSQQGLPADRIAWLEIHPADPRRMYAMVDTSFATETSVRLLATRDGGRTWRRIAREVPVAAGMSFDPRNPDILYLDNDGPVWRSTDGGETWVLLEHFPSTRALVFPAPRTMVAGACGIFRSVTAGRDRSWSEVLSCNIPDPSGGGEEFSRILNDLRQDPAAPATIYALAVEIGGRHPVVSTPLLYISRDGGLTWTPSLTGAAFLALPSGTPGTLYALAQGQVQKSLDFGQTWQPTGPPPGPGYTWTDFEVDQVDPATLYLSTAQSGVFRSTDEGRTWTPLNAGLARLGLLDVRSLVMHPAQPHRLFALPQTGIYEGRFPPP